MDTTELSPRIAIVEDDADLRQSLHTYLEAKGYPVWSEGSAEAFYKHLLLETIDIVILDIGLPGENGFEVARHLKAIKNIDVIIISGRSATEDRLQGLAEGANRYLIKPVDLRELEANIIAIGRGTQPQQKSRNPWQLIESEWLLISPERERIKLTSREWYLLHCLIRAHDQTASRAQIAQALNNPKTQTFDYHRIDMIVMRLRQKIAKATGSPAPIQTVQSFGFNFSARCRLH